MVLFTGVGWVGLSVVVDGFSFVGTGLGSAGALAFSVAPSVDFSPTALAGSCGITPSVSFLRFSMGVGLKDYVASECSNQP